jgi:hypothetical protein
MLLKPPQPLVWPAGSRTVFLAGAIEMGAAEDWQSRMATALASPGVVVLNPRRDAWDASWRQSIDNDVFREQVEWELEGQERADVIAMCFTADARAPITLLELGLFAGSGKLVVFCPEGYWRKGNVDVVCRRYGAEVATSFDDLVARTRLRLTS